MSMRRDVLSAGLDSESVLKEARRLLARRVEEPSRRAFLARVGADTGARYVGFKCADDYYTSIDMPTALHPQTQMSFKFDNKLLPRAYGFPMKIRIPTKLGFKQPKYVVAMELTNVNRGGYWSNQGYNWFSGL
jgi:DMSO/TMAO reductase YedYZ molybdopterin-dependent catalytic subunit